MVRVYDSSCTVEYLADDLGVSPGDVLVVLRWLDIEPAAGRISGSQGAEVRSVLDPHNERTVPELYMPRDPAAPRDGWRHWHDIRD